MIQRLSLITTTASISFDPSGYYEFVNQQSEPLTRYGPNPFYRSSSNLTNRLEKAQSNILSSLDVMINNYSNKGNPSCETGSHDLVTTNLDILKRLQQDFTGNEKIYVNTMLKNQGGPAHTSALVLPWPGAKYRMPVGMYTTITEDSGIYPSPEEILIHETAHRWDGALGQDPLGAKEIPPSQSRLNELYNERASPSTAYELQHWYNFMKSKYGK